MKWEVEFHASFEAEVLAFETSVRRALLAAVELLAEHGPRLGRPHADTLKGSKYANMKELRFNAGDGAWRTAFAFDPERKAILLVAGNKSGGNQKRFYKQLVATADSRFAAHLESLKAVRKEQ